MFTTSCFDIWRQEEESTKLITLCKGLDDTLKGGLQMQMITEFCGGPGTGKTQMCLQLCVTVQFPREVGGVGGKALYIDTNQDFHPTRLREIATGMAERFGKTFRRFYSQQAAPQQSFNAATLLDNVTYIYCSNYLEVMATVGNLRQMLTEDPTLKLVIIDSFSFPLRLIDEVVVRTHIVYELLTELQQLALEFELAIVITNELTTRVTDDMWEIHPSLGESHAHKINQRIILSKERDHEHYVAIVEKSVVSPKIAIPFQIKEGGIRGVR